MKVKELIEELQKCSPHAEVDVFINVAPGALLNDSFSVQDVEQHNPNMVKIFIK